jgi:hypothetical protein
MKERRTGAPWLVEVPVEYVHVKDHRKGGVRLEKGRRSIYDTQPWAAHSTICFFHNPNGRSEAYTNMRTAGQFTWPKRFLLDGIRISLSKVVDISKASFYFQIGEKLYFNLPLMNMERDDDVEKDAAAAPGLPPIRLKHLGITPSLYIPPVQHFSLVLNTGDIDWRDRHVDVRVQLDGMLYREIC